MEASKKMIYVGGLADEVDSKVLNAAFIPFGDIVEVNLPIDYETEKHRGFAFIEFELAEDASAAIDNMNDGEMFGRQLRVNLAKPMRNKEGGNRWECFFFHFVMALTTCSFTGLYGQVMNGCKSMPEQVWQKVVSDRTDLAPRSRV